MPEEDPNQGFDLSKQKIGIPDDMHGKEEAPASVENSDAAAPATDIPIIPQTDASQDPEKGTFLHLISVSLQILWSKKFTFLFYSLASILLVAAIQVVAIPLLFVMMVMLHQYSLIALILIYGITAFISYLFVGALMNQASCVYTNQKCSFGHSLDNAFKKTGKAIMVFLRTIYYSGLWILAIIMLMYSLLTVLAMSVGSFTVMIGGFILGLASIGVMVIGSIRMVRMSLAFPKLMGDDYVSAKDTCDYSKTYTAGKWWMIVSSMAAFSLLVGLVPLILNLLNTLIGNSLIAQIASWINFFAIIISYPLTLIFMQVLMHELGNPSRFYKANPWLVTLTVLIQLTPVIVIAVLYFFFPKNINIPQFTQENAGTQVTVETPASAVKGPRIKRQ